MILFFCVLAPGHHHLFYPLPFPFHFSRPLSLSPSFAPSSRLLNLCAHFPRWFLLSSSSEFSFIFLVKSNFSNHLREGKSQRQRERERNRESGKKVRERVSEREVKWDEKRERGGGKGVSKCCDLWMGKGSRPARIRFFLPINELQKQYSYQFQMCANPPSDPTRPSLFSLTLFSLQLSPSLSSCYSNDGELELIGELFATLPCSILDRFVLLLWTRSLVTEAATWFAPR